MTRVITYGTYDLLHQGHINLLRRAKELGDYLIVGVTSDSFDRGRGKLNVRNNVLERVEAVKATGYADEVIIEDYLGQKIDDIQKYDVDIFAIGSDWIGKFDYLNEYCKVVYLPRTEGISSTMLRAESQDTYKIGVIGSGRIANRFVPETKVVNGAEVVSVLNPDKDEAESFAKKHVLEPFYNFDAFIEKVDVVYVASPHLTHYGYIKKSLLAGKHVLCEIPFTLKKDEALELKPEGQRSWEWIWIHAKASQLNLETADKVIFLGKRYKVMQKKDYGLNSFVEYQLCRDYEETSVIVEDDN